jgi:hypothetical protein
MDSEIGYEGLEMLGGEPKPDSAERRGANQNRNDFKGWIKGVANCPQTTSRSVDKRDDGICAFPNMNIFQCRQNQKIQELPVLDIQRAKEGELHY